MEEEEYQGVKAVNPKTQAESNMFLHLVMLINIPIDRAVVRTAT